MISLRWLLAWALLLGLHLFQLGRLFGSFDRLTNDQPIVQVDHALHLYHGSLGSRCLMQHGKNWGYDPAFMAGYPKTPFHDPSAGLSDLACLLARGGYQPAAYKLMVLLTVASTPLLLALGAWLAGFGAKETWAGTAVAIVYYWADFSASSLDSGLVSFLWACGWLNLVAGLLLFWSRRPTVGRWVALAAATAFALFVHPTMPVLLLMTLAGFYLVSLRRHGIRYHLAAWLAVAFAILVNLFWIVPFIWLVHWRVPQFSFMVGPSDDPFFFLNFLLTNPFDLTIVLLALIGFFTLQANGSHRPAISNADREPGSTSATSLGAEVLRADARLLWICGTVTLFVLTYFGSLFDATRQLECLRFRMPLDFLLAYPAGAALAWVACGNGRAASMRSLALRAFIAILFAGMWIAYQWTPFPPATLLWYRLQDVRPFPIGRTPEMTELIAWLKENTTRDHRILLEDQLRLREATVAESLHWTVLLPVFVDREFVGGQYQCTPLVHRVAAFGDRELGGQPIKAYSPRAIADYLDRYNIGTVIAWSGESKSVFDACPFLEPMGLLPRTATPGFRRPDPNFVPEDKYFFYRYAAPKTYFAVGTGRVVRAELNRIELADVKPEGGHVVVRYHWEQTLVTDPPRPLRRYAVANDPVGFIEIDLNEPLDQLVIYNGY